MTKAGSVLAQQGNVSYFVLSCSRSEARHWLASRSEFTPEDTEELRRIAGFGERDFFEHERRGKHEA